MRRGDRILNARGRIGPEALRAIVYGADQEHCETEAMRKFINSRQKWCRNQIMEAIKIATK
jgi:hypothetical protein